MNINQIELHPIVGNAYSDMKLLDIIHFYVLDSTNTMLNRCRALNKLDRVTGYVTTPCTARDVHDYLEGN